MSINHRRPDVSVPQERLDRAEVVAGLQEMRGVTMVKSVRSDAFRKFRLSDRFVQRVLNVRVMKMIPPPLLCI